MNTSIASIVNGLVSVIVPVFNRSVLLREAVESALTQTYRPIEIIVVDDGSTDETREVTDYLAREHTKTIRVVHQSNGGPGRAREAGRVLARGEFIQYLDSDDLMLPRKVELQVVGLRARPDCGLSYGKTRHYQRGTVPKEVPWKRTGEKMEFMFPAFLKERAWSTITPLYRRAVTDRIGPWTALRQHEDWEYDCRVASLGVRLHHCDEFVADIRMHSGLSMSDRWVKNPAALQDRARAYALIYAHARSAGIDHTVPEMENFARQLFFVARQCGARRLAAESFELFRLARQASGPTRAAGWDFKTYRVMAALVGWNAVGKLAQRMDRCRTRTVSA